MNSCPSQWTDFDSRLTEGCGATQHGIARLEPVDAEHSDLYRRWVEARKNGEMAYLERYDDVRHDPRLLLDGARSIISFAFPYYHPDARPRLRIARYALGRDYHEVVRQRLSVVAQAIENRYGGATRVCVDTAPLRERYWATRSGLGVIGLNNQLIIPGSGSYFFLGFILTTCAFTPTADRIQADCGRCGRCIAACPAGALSADGSCDASKCLSYLTIEHRGDFPDGTNLHGCFYGCDRCAEVCPHNSAPTVTSIEEFTPSEEIMALTADDIQSLTPERFSAIFRHSPMKRAKLAGLQRNAKSL
ncbi:MAG: tRNA epoxyqueuosine(34) reductase QueG [Bacteroides sp.]|nr:tRNA epoxyqueuosine(34) reductase QueG [Bacteroides sp.]MCM1413840.1 tRNA epoxyqueuosine(34) reductase QueG [Bacteroides sp.]MCM1472397.1 tRNA epoxyqueuosine(34) reductase QueG [Bacteroides sp.]